MTVKKKNLTNERTFKLQLFDNSAQLSLSFCPASLSFVEGKVTSRFSPEAKVKFSSIKEEKEVDDSDCVTCKTPKIKTYKLKLYRSRSFNSCFFWGGGGEAEVEVWFRGHTQ